MAALIESFDALLLDLDGTVYRGKHPIDHAVPAIAGSRSAGVSTIFVTNNASRRPEEVAAHLGELGLPAGAHDVLTSPEVAARLLVQAHPAGSAVLVVGAPWLAEAVEAVGLRTVREAADTPDAVVQGLSLDLAWSDLAEAALAIRAGADWVATNTDATLPSDRGLLPGNGALVAALVAATGREPRVAGKPARPLLDEAIQRVGSARPLVVGDRLDTDIAAAVNAELPSLLVLTGASTVQDLLATPVGWRPAFVCLDLRGLLGEDQVVDLSADPEGWRVDVTDDGLVLAADGRIGAAPTGPDGVLGALAALLRATAQSTVEDPAEAVGTGGAAAVGAGGWSPSAGPGARPIRAADARAAQALGRLGFGTTRPQG